MIPREGGNPRWTHVTDVKYVLPVDAVLDQIPLVSQVGRPSKLNIHPSREPDLGWTLATTLNTVHTNMTNTTSLANTQVLQCTVPFTVQPFAYTSCTSRLRAPQGSHRMGDQWHQL